MTFKGWVEYPGTMICVHQDTEGFVTANYTRTGGNKIAGSERHFDSLDELEGFLLSIPNPPTAFINDFIQQLHN